MSFNVHAQSSAYSAALFLWRFKMNDAHALYIILRFFALHLFAKGVEMFF